MREARFSFNPCLFSGYVYLCGQCAIEIEAFSPQTDSFIPLDVDLKCSGSCSLFVYGNLLLILSSDYSNKYAAEPEGQLVLKSYERLPCHASKTSNSRPVLDSTRGLFFLIDEGKAISFLLETGERVQIFS